MRQADIPQNTVVRENTLKSTSFLRLPVALHHTMAQKILV